MEIFIRTSGDATFLQCIITHAARMLLMESGVSYQYPCKTKGYWFRDSELFRFGNNFLSVWKDSTKIMLTVWWWIVSVPSPRWLTRHSLGTGKLEKSQYLGCLACQVRYLFILSSIQEVFKCISIYILTYSSSAVSRKCLNAFQYIFHHIYPQHYPESVLMHFNIFLKFSITSIFQRFFSVHN